MLTKSLQDYIMLGLRKTENIEQIKSANDCGFEELISSDATKPYRGKAFLLNIRSMHNQIHDDIKRLILCIEKKDMHLAKSIMISGVYHQNVESFINSLTEWIGNIRIDASKTKK